MLTRVPRSQATTISHTFEVDETPTDPTGTPTYAVVDANGTAVQSGNATVVGGSTGRVTFLLAAQAALKRCTVTWTATVAAASTTATTYVEVAGGFFFSLAQGRASDESLEDDNKYSTDDLKLVRLEVEAECETICDRTFVPRYDRVVLDGTGTSQILLRPSDPVRSVSDVRSLRRISMAPQLDETFVDFSVAQLAAVAVGTDGTLTRTDGNIFEPGMRNVIVEWEYGLDGPPPDLVQASLTRLRTRLNFNKSGVPDRTTSFSVEGGGVFRYDMPGAFKTGLPEVDAVYARYSRRSGAGGRQIPASRSLNYDPQRGSLFHGGVR